MSHGSVGITEIYFVNTDRWIYCGCITSSTYRYIPVVLYVTTLNFKTTLDHKTA